MSDLGQCQKIMYNRWGGSQCPKPAKVERNGQKFCGTHDEQSPAKIKRKAEQDAKWKQEREWRNEKYEREDAIKRLCGHIATSDLGKYELVLKP